MPIYEYECAECGENIEDLREIAQRNVLPNCPKCGKPCARVIATSFSTPSTDSTQPQGPFKEVMNRGSVSTGRTGIRLENADNICIRNSRFANLGVGVSLGPGTGRVEMSGNTFRDVRNPIEMANKREED